VTPVSSVADRGRAQATRNVLAREDVVAHTFVELADTLVEGYDPIEFLHRLTESCVSLLGMTEAGVVLVDSHGQLRALGSSSERMHLIELFELQSKDGPCLDCWNSGESVREDHLADAVTRWPHFAPAALDAGFASVYAVPMRLRDERLGALNLFANEAQGLVESAEALAQALADVATIGILHERFIRQREEVSEQLQVAFNTRIVLEQAKGVVAQATNMDIDEAFGTLRGYARHHNFLLSDVAAHVIAGDLDIGAMAVPARKPRIKT
jgi:transcriptional regulator with GAF, ATPase, and Fis domain